MEKKIKIGNKEVTFRASAMTPYKYKEKFKEDMLLKMTKLSEENADALFLMQVAYVMSGAKESCEEWLDQFELVDLTEALPEIIEIMAGNMSSTQEANSKNTEAVEN